MIYAVAFGSSSCVVLVNGVKLTLSERDLKVLEKRGDSVSFFFFLVIKLERIFNYFSVTPMTQTI